MWTVTAGTTSGVSATLVNQSIAIVQGAAAYWSRYIDDTLANLSVRVNFVPLSDLTLAQGGTDYFLDRSSGGFDFLEAVTITELRTGVDENGSAPDIRIDIDTGELLAGEFYLGPLVNGLSANVPSNLFDLFTIIVHEIGHGLGILTFLDSAGNDRTDFDERVFKSGGNYFFNGPAATSVFGGNVPLDDSIAHLSEGTGSLLGPTISAGEMTLISRLDVAVLQDIGVPVRQTTNGNDLLWGFAGAEFISGGGGNDTLNAFLGPDVLLGGDGNDVLNGFDASQMLDGEAGNDTLNGGQFQEALSGGDGNDFIAAGAGDDVITAGPGADTVDGGDGFDWLDYDRFGAPGIVLNRAAGTASGGDAQGDVITSVEKFDLTAAADQFFGASIGEEVLTNGGGDLIDGGGGNDTLTSSASFLSPRDTLVGGAGADFLRSVGDVEAIVSYAASPGAVSVNILFGVGQFADAEGDQYETISRVIGSSFNDTLFGGASLFEGGGGEDDIFQSGGSGVLDGGAGNDTITALGADNVIRGGDGDDFISAQGDFGGATDISGGAGYDVVSFASASAVTVNLTDPSMNGGGAVFDTLRGDIEAIIGGLFDDFLQGNSGNNSLTGGRGNDTLIGGAGDDILLPGFGTDSVNGGDGFDIVSYADSGFVRVALWNPASNDGDAAGDIINFQVEVVEGSNFADNLQGNTGDNNLRGGGGNDLILGGFGSDTLLGGAGGDDFGGGDGFDVVSYANAGAAVRVALFNPTLHSGEAQGDNIRADIEVVAGSNFADTLEGSAANNNLRGGGGADAVFGGGGDDTLWGQAGNDTLTGGSGNDRFVFDAAGGADRIADFVGGPGLSDLINLGGFGAAFDSFAEVSAAATQSGADVVLDFGLGRTLTLANVALAALSADDFVYS